MIVDDHSVLREGLRRIINIEPDLRVCGEAANVGDARRLVDTLSPDIVVVDIALEGVSGLLLIKELRHKYARLPILVLSMHKEAVYAERALRAGANGYIMKEEDGTTLIGALHYVLEGKTYVSEALSQQLLRNLTQSKEHSASSALELLSTREFEVFRLISMGYGTRQVADTLTISIKTVETHREHIRAKLHLKTTFELTQFARTWCASEQTA